MRDAYSHARMAFPLHFQQSEIKDPRREFLSWGPSLQLAAGSSIWIDAAVTASTKPPLPSASSPLPYTDSCAPAVLARAKNNPGKP